MNRLVLFFKRIYVPLLFIILEVVAISYYSNSTPYTRAKILTASNKMTGVVNRGIFGARSYFGLRRENEALNRRISELNNRIELLSQFVPEDIINLPHDTEAGKYEYFPASVIHNSLNKQENFLIIDKGQRDGVKPNMALLTPEGYIAGYVLEVSENFATAMSVLNQNFRTGGKIENKDYFGSVRWDGLDHSYVTLSEIPKYAEIAKGDTIVSAYSSIFPSDAVIGTVESYELNSSGYYDSKIRLAAPMGTLRTVLVVNYAEIQERMLLEEGLY